MDADERHDPEALWVCGGCGETFHEDVDNGTSMCFGGIAWEDQPTYCEGCAGECGDYVEGHGVL